MITLKILLIIYSIIDVGFLFFLFQQYKVLIKSEEYTTDSLINKFIVGILALGGIIFTITLLVLSLYYCIVV